MATQPTALDRSFADLLEKHDLLNLSVTFSKASAHTFFSASVQWADASQERGRDCTIGHGATIAEALSKALAEMHTQRAPVSSELADVALEAA